VRDDVILVETAGVLRVGDHVVIVVLLPGAAAVANSPGDRTEINGAAAVVFEPVKELVDIPGVGNESGKNRGCDVRSQPRFFPLSSVARPNQRSTPHPAPAPTTTSNATEAPATPRLYASWPTAWWESCTAA